MASNESATTFGDTIGGDRSRMASENSDQVIVQQETEKETEVTTTVSTTNSATQPRTAAYRGVRFAVTGEVDPEEEEDSWWWEVENENLTLDQVPNVTSVFTPSPQDIIDKPHCIEETHAVVPDEDFDRLHRLADRIKSTINEQRERHLSESSDKSITDAGKQEVVPDSVNILETPKEQSLEEFKEELRVKRQARQTAVQDFRDEITSLRKQLEREREISKRLRNGETVEEIPQDLIAINSEKLSTSSAKVDTHHLQGACAVVKSASSLTSAASDVDDEDPLSRSRHANIELANAQYSLQMANSENISLRGELAGVQKQVGTLKEVVACCKQMLSVKEEQCNELKDRLTEIEKAFAEHEMKIMSDNLRQEYERQLVNIRQLRQLYEERQRVAAAEYENLQRLISIKRDELAQEQEKTKNLEERNVNLVKEVDEANNELACLRDECKEHKFEKSSLKEEIGAVNTLFSQMVMGFNGKNNLDIDRLTTMLEENRTLLNDMATKECTDGATLPKLLFELVEQASVDNGKKSPSGSATPSTEIAQEHKNNGENDNENDDDVDDVETTTSQGEEDDDVDVEVNDNENMAAVANDNIAQATATTTSTETATPPTAEHRQNVEITTDVVDAAAVGGSASSVATVANEKVIVATTTTVSAKSKKPHHHHRKAASCKKSTTSSSSSVEAAATLKFNDPEVIGKVTSAQEIIGNLPKVWRVLMELLSHHQIDPVQFEENGKGEDCYKSVETPNGPKAELSVSKTYLKLKDLILEKKSLVKETNRLKTLNCHLDYRLNEQEKRLSSVSLELTKTWHLVGKMQRQHRQLHTQEQILRYQLQQKRRLLHELKDELEYCRRKWQAARAKNDESQEQCNDLRREFARRKLEDANNSAESGYSDSGGQVSDEEASLALNDVGAVGGGAQAAAMEEDEICEASSMAASAAGGCVNYRRKRLREHFEHTRKIKRMQSTSPGRANDGNAADSEVVVVLRWNSAPPTCGWRDAVGVVAIGNVDDSEEDDEISPSTSSDTGAIPKSSVHLSRRTKRRSIDETDCPGIDQNEPVAAAAAVAPDDRAARIQRLEQQCKNLIQQVLETSDNRERLEVQLKRFQDEMSPVQYAVPLDEVINKKRYERMTRASSAPVSGSGSLTPREEEYTRKRSERLGRLEEESRQLMFRIKRTSDRGHYLRCSLDRIRRAPPSREGSFESNTEEESRKPEDEQTTLTTNHETASSSSSTTNVNKEDSPSSTTSNKSPLTAEEEAYTARRSARLQRLEEESKQLLNTLSRNNTRTSTLGSRLDTLHERHGSQPAVAAVATGSSDDSPTTSANSSAPGQLTTEQRIENIEKISSNREQRLRILEEEGRQLINRLSETSEKGTKMINRIAERELNRQNRSTPQRETGEPSSDNKPSTSSSVRNPLSNDANAEEVPEASAMLPPLKNVACTSIVSEELTDRVTITTIPSQIAANQGAIPKTKPTTQLLASRPKSARIRSSDSNKTQNAAESLEDMVKRLQSLPFPNREEEKVEKQEQEQEQHLQLPANSEDEVTENQESCAESVHEVVREIVATAEKESCAEAIQEAIPEVVDTADHSQDAGFDVAKNV